MSRRKLSRAGRRLEALVTGVLAFILASIAFSSFQKAIYEPLVNWLTGFLGEGIGAYLILLIASSSILVFILKRKLPFVKCIDFYPTFILLIVWRAERIF